MFPTGAAALADAIGALLSAGDHAFIVETVFSPTRALFDRLMARMGVAVDSCPADATDLTPWLKATTRVLICFGALSMASKLAMPVAIVNGAHPGPTLWLNGAVHVVPLIGAFAAIVLAVFGIGRHAPVHQTARRLALA